MINKASCLLLQHKYGMKLGLYNKQEKKLTKKS